MGSSVSAAGDTLAWSEVPKDSWKSLATGSTPGEIATFGGRYWPASSFQLSLMARTLSHLEAGCYWGTEKYFTAVFTKKHPGSIIASAVGFMGGSRPATYEDVCGGQTGHVEVLQLAFDGTKVLYDLAPILKAVFFMPVSDAAPFYI